MLFNKATFRVLHLFACAVFLLAALGQPNVATLAVLSGSALAIVICALVEMGQRRVTAWGA